MKHLAKIGCWAALGLTIVPPLLLMMAQLSESQGASENSLMTDARMKAAMALGTVLWFVAAPFWLKQEE